MFLSTLKPRGTINGRLSLPLSMYGFNAGLWVLRCCPRVHFLPFLRWKSQLLQQERQVHNGFLGHEIIYFRIPKYHFVWKKARERCCIYAMVPWWLVGPLPTSSRPARWPTPPTLVSLTAGGSRSQAESGGVVWFVWRHQRCFTGA